MLMLMLNLAITRWVNGVAGILESIAGMRRSICIIVGGCGGDEQLRARSFFRSVRAGVRYERMSESRSITGGLLSSEKIQLPFYLKVYPFFRHGMP